MLVSPKWQTMWLESQHCSKTVMNVPLPSQQTKKILEDLRTNCCSPNKLVQLEALKCWGMWINCQNSDDWKLNTVCFTAVRPLITKKMLPLHKDVDICKLKLSLMWALLVKVENMMQLEGPQYILEVFLDSCLLWLSSASEVDSENEVSALIFQLLLSILKKNEIVDGYDKETFIPLTTDILHLKKVFCHLADKFLNIFIHWGKVPDKSMFLKLWKHFLEHCELSCEHIPIPLWHKVFKLADEICSEKNEPVAERLAFLHSCATTLKSALSSSKFIDFGNLLTTPCEALFKKLVELCTTKCTERCDLEMFSYSKEICQMLSDKSVAIGGFDLCIRVLDVLEEFWHKELLWGVWCGLVYCYKIHLKHLDKNHLTEVEMKFYRKLRGVAVNFELDRDTLHKDCLNEVEKHIEVLNINCFCSSQFKSEMVEGKGSSEKGKIVGLEANKMDIQTPETACVPAERIVRVAPPRGNFSTVALCKRTKLVARTTDNLKFDLIKHILKNIDAKCTKSLFNYLSFRCFKAAQPIEGRPVSFSLQLKADDKEGVNLTVTCVEPKAPSHVPDCSPVKRNAVVLYDRHRKAESDEKKDEEEEEEEVISTPKTRSRKRIEEEMKGEMECQKRKKRKSFEVLVQEIVRKNKERKTEKNSRRKSPVLLRGKRNKKKIEKPAKENRILKKNENGEVPERNLRNRKKEEENEKIKGKKPLKTDGKLENYFKVITRKSGSEVKKDEKKPRKGKMNKEEKRESVCCNAEKEESEKKGEIGWRQTSLKTMMNRKNKTDKKKPELRTRSKSAEVSEEKGKVKKGNKVTGSPLSKLSPFKEVFHDHEYAKIEPEQLKTFERVLRVKQERVLEADVRKKSEKTNVQETRKENPKKPKVNAVCTKVVNELPKVDVKSPETLKLDEVELLEEKNCKIVEVQAPENEEQCKYSEDESEKLKSPEESSAKTEVSETERNPSETVNSADEAEPEEAKPELPGATVPDVQPTSEVVAVEESLGEVSADLTPSKRGRKRMRMLDSLKPSKKMRLEEEDPQEERLPLEITEKENLEEKQSKLSSPTKKEKSDGSCRVGKCDGSPKAGNGMIASRALRMIALVPESTKGSQMQWESTPRVEVLKCKKAPNVDKNSRASKMLALLSENVIELEEADYVKAEEITSQKGMACTPNVKTPLSSLKSPKSNKKRRSIRFDDAKNETVVYQTDTPPSQILEEKEKCRRFKPAEL